MPHYEADITFRVKMTYEPNDDESIEVAGNLAALLKNATVLWKGPQRIGVLSVVEAEVADWKGVTNA